MLLLQIYVLMGQVLEGSLIDLRRCWLIVDLILLAVMILYYEVSEHFGGKYVCLFFGKLRFLELGRSWNVGHVSSVGIPTNSNIYYVSNPNEEIILLRVGQSHSFLVVKVP
jgi:hypothetical protein